MCFTGTIVFLSVILSFGSGSFLSNKDLAFNVTQNGEDISGLLLLKFDTVDYNTGNGYNKSTGFFTAPTSGTYIFWINVHFSDFIGVRFIFIYHGSHLLTEETCEIETSGHNCEVYPTITTHLDVGDEVHFTTSWTNNIDGAGYSSYGGALLHAS